MTPNQKLASTALISVNMLFYYPEKEKKREIRITWRVGFYEFVPFERLSSSASSSISQSVQVSTYWCFYHQLILLGICLGEAIAVIERSSSSGVGVPFPSQLLEYLFSKLFFM